MPAKTVFENLEAGATIAEVMEWFGVSREEIDSLMAFVARSLEKELTYAEETTPSVATVR
jgi:uncharacterized protein (DUF433 family)